MINLSLIATIVGIAVLLVLGLRNWRGGLNTLVFVATGVVMILLAYRSDQKLQTLISIFVGGALVCAIVTLLHLMLAARRRRTPVYVPRAQRREVAKQRKPRRVA